jgi:predicted lipoprotein with Yx(FWY)xxD motif
MKRILFSFVIAALAGASLAGGAVAPTVKTLNVATLGTVLVSASGRTLYHYTDEARGKVDCTGGCAKLWPPLVVKKGAKPVAGAGVSASKLGVLERPDGTSQVTYAGFGLYRYAGDTKQGQAKGEGLESSWYALSSTAKIVKPAAPASTGGSSSGGAMTTPASTTMTGGGSDYGY